MMMSKMCLKMNVSRDVHAGHSIIARFIQDRGSEWVSTCSIEVQQPDRT
jgi:hypothetical protein